MLRSNYLLRRLHRQSTARLFTPTPCRKLAAANEQIAIRCASVAIVGSGPSACYTAKYLLQKKDPSILIDMIERLPTPYGLVRYGVAPDHPEVKNVQHDFDKLFDTHSNQLRYWGNVTVGDNGSQGSTGVSVQELRERYDAVVLAYGCEGPERTLGIPGEETLRGVLSARAFVAWYNGHPDYAHIGPIVEEALSSKRNETGKPNVVVVGHGNVALDCARILAKGATGLMHTDLATRALSVLQNNPVQRISVVGRRGHVQGAFTIKELRELVKLESEGHDTDFLVRYDEFLKCCNPSSLVELKESRPKQRIDKLLWEAAGRPTSESNLTLEDRFVIDKSPTKVLTPIREPRCSKQLELRFLLNPVEFQAHHHDSTALGAVMCEHTVLSGVPGAQKAANTGEQETLEASLALVSIGYKGLALPGTEDWFDAKVGLYKHTHGKVANVDPVNGLGAVYATGWIKRGPTGIIGSNIADARETVQSVVADLQQNAEAKSGSKPGETNDLASLLQQRSIRFVDWNGVQKIEAAENANRRHEKQPREKVTDIAEMLTIAGV